MMNIFLLIASYLIGAIPFGLLVGRWAGVDVRGGGSGNIGATNVGRLLGKKYGALTLILDVLKGFVPISLAAMVVPAGEAYELILLGCGIMAVVGHMFPVYLMFRGGKGVATALGVFLFLSPAAVVISVVVFTGAVALSGYVSAGSLLASGLFPLWLMVVGKSWVTVAAALLIAALIWIKHRANIGRLLNGTEQSWRQGKDNAT
jgi:glycerol-3-phosphate acyltransferase PlsY